MNLLLRRKIINIIVSILFGIAVILAVFPLLSIVWYILIQGIKGINIDFFTKLSTPVGIPGGGMANAIMGSLQLVVISSLISIPVGIAVGVYLSEYGRNKLASMIQFMTNVLSGVPSIVVGLLVYSTIVLLMGRFSALSGGIALAIIMLPLIIRTTEQALRLVPHSYREAAYALGATESQTLFRIVLPAASQGIITGILLAVARAMGESAPLLFTAFGSNFWNWDLTQPIAALPLQLYVYAISPYPEWHQQAWAGALTLLIIVLVLNLTARFIARKKS
ncbi:phosphate ABC transporter permease PstA [Sporolactobacillus terrae]|uniref:Phosphate transport system permease protein PstA n=1 Tax=Sporolactobacillus terrae TaxID=269673 RepID=A0A5K7WV77_9BACL|nr:phosphate ABC transporter permease PstA [Sporolactobacillus terrae]BBN97599.1 phosphate transport system permease protein PstA [Sporolactobacillus terrae]